ncbi:MAG: hypothetical protein GY715_02845 [Planctomycetes bacterium]|nr:hypothetical protein [Planctomycetota bacterium]
MGNATGPVTLLCALLLLPFGSMAAAAPPLATPDLLTPAAPAKAAARAVDHAAIARHRIVTIDRGALDAPPAAGVRATFFDDASFVLLPVATETKAPGRSTTSGTLEGIEGGSFVLVARDERILLNVWAPGHGVFHLRELGDGTYAARQIDSGAFPPCATEAHPPGLAPGAAAGAAKAGEPIGLCVDDGSVIDILVVYTAAARIAEGGTAAMEMLIDACESSSNIAYGNSAMATTLNIVGMVEVDYTETGDSALDRAALTDPDDGIIDEVHDMRDSMGADLVAMILDDLENCGRAHFTIQEDNTPVPRLGFSVSRRDCVVDNLTFVHELGHNQGARHDRGADNSEAAFLYGHGYIDPGGTFRTVMAVFTDGVDRVQYFSNPDVLFMGLPMGIAPGAPDSAHNALMIDNTAFNAANLRPSIPQDCNSNSVFDSDDIINGTSDDANDNGIPDECEEGEVFFVSASATGAGDGSGWADAFTDLQAALVESASLCRPVSEIWVAAGTYRPDLGTGDRNATFKLRSGLALYGGFAGNETNRDERDAGANPTILSGDLAGNDIRDFVNNAENAIHVVDASGTDETSRLDGFVIEGGNAAGASGTLSHGAGMFFDEGSPVVVDCVFRHNSTHSRGGALGMVDSSSPLFVNCRFLRNRATGGTTRSGGVVSSLLFNSDGDPVWINCEFSGNGATGNGGVAVTDSPLLFINCTFASNVAAQRGGAFAVETNGDVELHNCILWRNADEEGMDESAQVHLIGSADASASHSIIQGLSTLAGSGNIDADPKFVDFDGPDNAIGSLDDDFRLFADSAAIDAADNTALPADTADIDRDGDTTETMPVDKAGATRFVDDPDVADTGTPDGVHPALDMGAHERQALPCFGDVDGSGSVGFGDILGVIGGWGPCPGCPEDLSGNGVLDFADILQIIGNWGPC